MPPKKSKDSKNDNKKRKLNEVDKTSTTTTTTTSDVGKKPALKRAKTQYTNYNSIITMPMGYPNTQEKPFVYEDKDDPPLIQLITIRRDVGLYMFDVCFYMMLMSVDMIMMCICMILMCIYMYDV